MPSLQSIAQPSESEMYFGDAVGLAEEIEANNEPGGWVDAVDVSEDTLRELLKTTKPLRFDWENKWLRGDQYAHMLNNIDGYREAFGMEKLGEKQHPENIYLEPQSKCKSKIGLSGHLNNSASSANIDDQDIIILFSTLLAD